MDQPNVSIQRVQASEWQIYRDLRLSALKLDPSTFGTKFEDAVLRSEADWQQQVQKFSQEPSAICLLAFVDGEPHGMVSCYISDKAEMVQMWVNPTVRGRNLGKALVNKLKDWVQQTGRQKLWASVYKDNLPAIKLYEKLGFSKVSESDLEFLLVCPL